jgi:hypothetical protein
VVQPESRAFALPFADADTVRDCSAHAIRHAFPNANSNPDCHVLPDSGANDLAIGSIEKGER